MNWIKWNKGLTEHPKVLELSQFWKCSPIEAAGRCMVVWEWADGVTEDGIVDAPVEKIVTLLASRTGDAQCVAGLEKVGWLHVNGRGVIFHNFEENNGNSAKKRAQHAARQESYRNRESKKVTQTASRTSDASRVTREEKRRVE